QRFFDPHVFGRRAGGGGLEQVVQSRQLLHFRAWIARQRRADRRQVLGRRHLQVLLAVQRQDRAAYGLQRRNGIVGQEEAEPVGRGLRRHHVVLARWQVLPGQQRAYLGARLVGRPRGPVDGVDLGVDGRGLVDPRLRR